MYKPVIRIKPPKRADTGYTVKAPWMLRQADRDYVVVEHGGARLYVPGEGEPAVVETSLSFGLDDDGTVIECSATVRFNMPDGNHQELGSLALDPVAMFAECFRLEEEA